MLREGGFGEAESRFQILGRLGSGGFGAVYEANDVRTGQRLAIKVLDNTSADSIARFKREFRALADCHHPNLVSLKELIEENGRWLIAMELIDGLDFLKAVQRSDNDDGSPPGRRYDEPRLRAALIGMVEGLRALHGFGILHRDLKPSNVRVRGDGRAVLLDFGLATSVDAHQQSAEIAVGTVRYMAPEQISSSVGRPADFYALGACLFEALTGRAPFDGEHPLQILLDKQQKPAPRASSLVASVPADLDDLCARLLATDPEQRPGAEEVLALLGATTRPERRAQRAIGSSHDVFAGRDAELAHLERALARTHQGELRVVLIEGESGVGKSELVAEFVRRARVKMPDLVALHGRCYENEQVAYKAFDGCVDELAKLLRRMTKEECAALLPTRAVLLGQLFPVLRNVPAIELAPRGASSADPAARRLEAFRALSSLLSKLAEERPLVLVVDDLQWADAESFRLLHALAEPSDRPPLLLLATIRPRDELEPLLLAQIEAVRKWKHTDIVQLFGLPRAQAKVLAAKLLGEDTPSEWLDMIADESDGHPLFLSELVQYTRSHDFAARSRLTLEAALRARIERLDWRARELLELAALAARPFSGRVFAHAMSLSDVDEVARSLLAAKLLKLRKGQELGCYHDRIRRSVVELVATARLPALHYRLAAALSASADADGAEQARHWDLAGESERAVATYENAAARSLEALAFTRAAALCARAIELVGSAADDRRERLLALRAHALACAGLSGEAAVLYQHAAERAKGEQRIRLRTRAAQQLMLSGRLVEGFEAARTLLRELGVSVPRSTFATLLRMAWDRLWLSLSSGRERRRNARATERRRIASQVVEELVMVIAQVNPLGGIALGQRGTRLLEANDSTRARALNSRGWMLAADGSLSAALPLFEQSRKLLRGADPVHRGLQAFGEGSARLAAWDWIGARVCLDESRRLLEEHCPDRPWQITQVRYHSAICWYHLGEHGRLAREADVWLAEARERNDRLGAALMVGMGLGFMRHLLEDAPEAALSELDQVLSPLPRSPFSFAHFGQLSGRVLPLVYQRGAGALRWLDAFELEYKGEFLLKTSMGKDLRLMMRSLALLAAYASGSSAERSTLFPNLQRVRQKLASRASPYMQAYATLISAQLAAVSGRNEQALSDARSARLQFESVKHGTIRPAAYLEGLLEGGASGRALREQSVEAYRREGWRDPVRGLSLSVPLLPLLIEREAGAARSRPRRLLDRYEVRAPLGPSGPGNVVVARDVHTGRDLALKELVHQSGAALERFKREFRALQGLHHANLSSLEALFEHEGRWYIALELIDGGELLSYVRPGGVVDAARLRSAFLGLTRGLSALHNAGFVHRNVSPESVRMAGDGRAVLVDFGVIARSSDDDDASDGGGSAYAAPEQLRGAPPDVSADVYALGVCLHQALYGTLLAAHVQPSTSSLSAQPERDSTADELALICRRMLSASPNQRPTLAEVEAVLALSQLHASSRRISLSPPSTSTASEPEELSFAGRERELLALGEAFERTCDDGLTIAIVQGESGIGKSSLVSEFARRVRENWPALLLLESRCYENEQLPYKAFDGAIDQLARMLRQLPGASCESLLPRRAALLAQLFPVLGSVPAIDQASKKGLPADPAAQKLAARECFIQLLETLSARHELLFVVDDLQWADSESFALLSDLVQHAKSLPIFFLCTVRSHAELDVRAAAEVERLRALPSTELIQLTGLSDTAARELLRALYTSDVSDARLALLVQESKGHPLFLRELVVHDKRVGERAPGAAALTLDGALQARIATFSAEKRELLALVAMAGRPLGGHLFARAMERSELPRNAISELLADGILRRRGESDLACYHDRMRRAVLDTLDGDTRKQLANRLALALEGERAIEPAERARLWDEAGELARAVREYEQAGDRALEGLAFGRAEQHYSRALTLLAALDSDGAKDGRSRRLGVARATALARAGRSREAARAYQLAAAEAEGEAKVRLRILAAQQLLQSAQVAEGMHESALLLDELGLSLPSNDRSALVRIAWERARATVQGTKLASRNRSTPLEERLVLEALRGLSPPVRDVSYLAGSTLVAQYLRRALAAGDPGHSARALAYEGLWRTVRAPHVSQEPLLEQSRALADQTGDPSLIADVELVRGLMCIASAQFKIAPVHLALAHELLQTRCAGEPWLLTHARMYLGASWYYTGDMAALARNTGSWVAEAQARDDRYAVAALTGFGRASTRHLIVDAPELAAAELETVMAPWSNELFSTIHYGACLGHSSRLGYAEGAGLIAWMEANEPRWQRAFLMRTPACRFSLATLKGWGLLLAAAEQKGSERRMLLERINRELAVMRRNRALGVSAVADLYEGIVHAASQRADQALTLLGRAAQQLEQVGHYLAPGARYLEGVVEGGDGGRQKRELLVEIVRAERWADESRGLRFRTPGLQLLT